MNKKKIDANEFWEKRELKQSWGKVLLSIVIVCFTLFYGAYCLDMYMGAHNLTFVKFKINPEFGFIVNGNDEVVHYLSLNDDARKIFTLDMFKGKKTSEAIDKAVEVARENNYLVDENKKIEVTVISNESNNKEIIEDKIVSVIKKKDDNVVAEVVEATEEEKEIFSNIKLDKIIEVEETVKKKEEEKKICNYTKVVSEDMSGTDRYITAVNTAKRLYPNGSKNVILISGSDMIQGILSSSFASVLDAPILLVENNNIRQDVLNQLMSLGVENVYLLGGSGVISDNIVQIIKDNLGINPTRLFGADRFITSTVIAEKMNELETITSVVIAPGENEPVDAAMLSAVAANKKMPILYTKKDSLASNVKEFIQSHKDINTIYVAGGLINNNVIKELESLGRSVTVIKGADRYITNAEGISKFQPSFRSVVVVNNLVDVVVASRFASKNNSALFYTGNNLSQSHINLLKNNTNVNKLYYFGGTDVMPAYRNTLYNIKKSNMNKCDNVTEELLYSTKSVVFYVPHQDDESSHYGRNITAAIDKLGAENVYVVVMTKGNASAIYIGDKAIPANVDTSNPDNKDITYLTEPVNNQMLKDYGYVDANDNPSFMMARDAEFRNSMKALGVLESNYKFAEELVGLEGITHTDRFNDKGLASNINHVKNIMKYYDKYLTKKHGSVTHISYTYLDEHTDHNTLGKALMELHYDNSLDNTEFENVYYVIKITETHSIDSRFTLTLTNKKNYDKQLNSFKAYEMDKENKILGVGYRSASGVFETFIERIDNETLETPMHVPFKK